MWWTQKFSNSLLRRALARVGSVVRQASRGVREGGPVRGLVELAISRRDHRLARQHDGGAIGVHPLVAGARRALLAADEIVAHENVIIVVLAHLPGVHIQGSVEHLESQKFGGGGGRRG